jgi:hypothetical protein
MSEDIKNIESNFIINNFLEKSKNTKLFTCSNKNNEQKTQFILKNFNNKNNINNDSFYKFLNKIKNLNSKNLAKIIGGEIVNKNYIQNDNENKLKNDTYFIIIEKYFDLSNLITYLNEGFNEEITKLLFIQILNGLKDYNLNEIKVNHIYLNNLLINNNNNSFNLVLSDVFLENVIEDNNNINVNKLQKNLNKDLALILIELVTGKISENLIKYINNISLFWKVFSKNNQNLEISENYVDLINKLIKNDSFDSFYNNYVNNNNQNNNQNNQNNLNYYEKIMFHPWFNNIKINDILDNINGIYNIVINEVKKRIETMQLMINENNNESFDVNISIPNNNKLFRSHSKSTIFFSCQKCVNFKENNNYFWSFIKIKSINNEIEFMNYLANFCENLSNYFKISEKYFRFILGIKINRIENYNNKNNNSDNEEENDDDDSNFVNPSFKIELQKNNKNNNYQLNIYRLSGDKILFYKFYKIILKKFQVKKNILYI